MGKLVAQCLTQNLTDLDILRRRSFDVNMRLYESNAEYQSIIGKIVNFMGRMICMKFDDYAELKGMSGANIGIPLNIIAVKAKSRRGLPKKLVGTEFPEVFFFLNPKIVEHSKKTTVVKSNCGSIDLSSAVKVVRYDWIDLEAYNLVGEKELERYGRPLSFTIQHEIDHNAGVLITDKVVREV